MATGCMEMEGTRANCGMKLSGCGKFWMVIMQAGPGLGLALALAQVLGQEMKDHFHFAARAWVQHKQMEQLAKERIYREEDLIDGGIILISSTIWSTFQTIHRYRVYVLLLRIFWIL